MIAPSALIIPLDITTLNRVFKLSTTSAFIETAIDLTIKTYTTYEEIRSELEAKLTGTGYEVTLNNTNQLVFTYPSKRLFVASNVSGSSANQSLGFSSLGFNTPVKNEFRLQTGFPAVITIFEINPILYTSNAQLLSAVQTSLSGSRFSAAFIPNSETIYLYSNIYFLMVSQGSGGNANVTLGFSINATLGVNAAAYNSYTFPPIDFIPPSTISDTHVFVKLVGAEMFGHNPGSVRIPYTVSILNLPQPVGVITEQDKECRPSKRLGVVSVRGVSEKSPRILTHIPDGLQQLVFQVDQLYQAGRDFYISDNQVYIFTLEFEVSTHK